ncbi:MAG TPA: hypothetical protein VLJ61_00195 [Pyrinomonadaceae bacterium]|nr:hypothetical protein [Pyrinomonadaceae bacterium]
MDAVQSAVTPSELERFAATLPNASAVSRALGYRHPSALSRLLKTRGDLNEAFARGRAAYLRAVGKGRCPARSEPDADELLLAMLFQPMTRPALQESLGASRKAINDLLYLAVARDLVREYVASGVLYYSLTEVGRAACRELPRVPRKSYRRRKPKGDADGRPR